MIGDMFDKSDTFFFTAPLLQRRVERGTRD